jgi:hypothetical protein
MNRAERQSKLKWSEAALVPSRSEERSHDV